MLDLPLVPGEVVAWRAWKIVERREGPRLRSLYHDVVWPTGDWLVATNSHGICAAVDRGQLEWMHRYGDEAAARYVRDADCVGRVGLAGEIVEGEHGYEAEKARVLSIVLPYRRWELLAGLRAAYRVPVSLGNVLHRGEMSWI